MEKLKDIKGIVQVSDYSLYYLLAILLAFIVVLIVAFYLYRKPRARKKPTSKEIALKNLQDIDFQNPKDIAYGFTLNIPFFISDENRSEMENLLEKLEIYKYKKEIPNMEEELKQSIKKIIKGLR